MSTSSVEDEKVKHPGPHWAAGVTPIKVGSYTTTKPVIDENRCIGSCGLACPAGTNIKGFIALLANGQHAEALKLIKQTNPLPLTCGRVCTGFCENKCYRSTMDESVAINLLERFVADCDCNAETPYVPEVGCATGHKVAIIGGGPAGLSAAYYLANKGHQVSIFEANSQLGGMLAYGIPDYRLPKIVLDKEIATITELCHGVHCNASLGRDFTIESLKRSGYEAIFIAIGTQLDEKMGIEGENLLGVLPAISFLRDVAIGKKVNMNMAEKIVVIGGGNTAVDAARSAKRLLAEEVTILYRRARDVMPAIREEVEGAEQEGVHLHFLAAPVRVIAKDGRVGSLECIRMRLGEPDESDRRKPEPMEGSEFILEADTIIVAVGQTVDASGLPKEILGSNEYINANRETMETGIAGVFAGGDCVSGAATVVEAIAAGRRAAISMNQYLAGHPIAASQKPSIYREYQIAGIAIKPNDEAKHLARARILLLPPMERQGNFREIKLGLTEEMAKREAARCVKCGSCLCCWLFCPDGAISLKASDNKLTIEPDLCKSCGICAYECPLGAIQMLPMG